MNCSHCIKTAKFKCACLQPFMCSFHIRDHLNTRKNHPCERLDDCLPESRISPLRSELMKIILNIYNAKSELASKSKSLVESIERALKHASDNLDAVIKIYVELLKQLKFCSSDLKIIEEIECLDINVQTIEIGEITTLVENTFSKNLITFKKKIHEKVELNLVRSNRYLDMTLKQKIDYFFPIVLNKVLVVDPSNYWQERAKELLVSNDGKYLFVCKLYLGMIQ